MKTDATDYEQLVLPIHEQAYGDWLQEARLTAFEIAKQGGRVCADDIWLHCPPPPGADPRCMGAVWHPRDAWKVVAYEKSARKVNHGRPIAIWALRGM